ncbi:MAG: LysM peptidoglycan-binding domain-containing protein, partial [Myxococcales bacterium]
MPTVTRTTVTPTAPRSTGPATHTVVRGDTMSAIARQHGTTVQALVDANKARYPGLATNAGNISVGWQLTIPGRGGATTPAPTPAGPRSNDDVLLVGMGDHAKYEATELKKRANVTFVGDSFEDDKVKVGNTTYDLRTDQGIRSFVQTLALPAEQAKKVEDAIRLGGSDARDELAQLAQVWAKAEKGGTVPSRLMLSGHSVGNGVWGDNNGTLSLNALGKLAEAMPEAARQVEDLHISGCYSGGEHAMERYRAIFPKVKTIWAYTGSAPGSYSGAVPHHNRWEAATRGSRGDLDRALANGTRKGENVAVWSIDKGYIDGNTPASIDQIRSDVQRSEGAFERHLSGELAVQDPQTGPLRDYYNRLQRLIQHPGLP